MSPEHKRRNIALLVLVTGIVMFVLMLIFVLPYFMSEKKYGEMQTALNEGDYYKVFKTAQFLLEQDPSTIQAYYFRGQAYLALKKYLQAERDLEKVIMLNEQYSNMRNVGIQLGGIYHQHGLALLYSEPDKSYRLFKKALKYLPREMNIKKDLAEASYLVGQAVEVKNKRKAETYYREALKYYPEKASYSVALARVLYHLGNSKEAIGLFKIAFDTDANLKTPANLALLNNALWRLVTAQERNYFSGSNTDLSVINNRLDEILQINDTSKEAWLEKLSLAINTNNFQEADKILKDIIKKGIMLPVDDISKLVYRQWNEQPQILYADSDQTEAGLKLDSDLAWSADGSKIIVKAMDNTSSKAKIFVYNFNNGSKSILQSQEDIDWEGEIFTPRNDGIIVISKSNIFRVVDNSLKKIAQVDGTVFDVTKDGQDVLIGKVSRLYKYNIQDNRARKVSFSRDIGQPLEAIYSPENKRIAVSGGEEEKQLAAILSNSRTRLLTKGDIFSPKWSWDGITVYFIKKQNAIYSLFSANVNTRKEPLPITKPELNVDYFQPSPLNNSLIYKGKSGKEILWFNDAVANNTIPITPRFGQFGKFIWSPDATKVAYLFSPVRGGIVRLELINLAGE